MSVEAMAVVLHHSRAKGTRKLVLLGIANHEGDGGAWPTMATLAIYANADVRTVQRAVEWLVGKGELAVLRQAGGTPNIADHHRPNLYKVRVTCPPWCDRTTRHRDTRTLAGPQLSLSTGVDNPVDNPAEGVTPVSPHLSTGVTPVSPGGVTPVSPKPPNQPSITHHPSAEVQDTRVCTECAEPAHLCIPRQLRLHPDDRHPFTPRTQP